VPIARSQQFFTKDAANQSVLASAFREFDSRGIRYTIWKSFDRWRDSLSGKTDVDLLVHPDDLNGAIDILRQLGWVRLKAEFWRRFPGLHDLVSFDHEAGRLVHLHLHERLVMGEKFIKSLSPPWVELYLERTETGDWPRRVQPEVEFITFVVRLCLKLRWIDYARVVRRWNRRALYRDFRPELDCLRARCDRDALLRLLEIPAYAGLDGRIVVDAFDRLDTLDFRRRRRMRRAVGAYRSGGPLTRFVTTLGRKISRKLTGSGKQVSGRGISVAVCGPDGSGKTTLVNEIETILAAHVLVERHYMGGNRSSAGLPRAVVVWLVWPVYLVSRFALKAVGWRSGVRATERLFRGIDAWLMALEKRGRLRRGQRAVARGGIALYERFPLFPGYGDAGPADSALFGARAAREICAALPLPDLLIIIDADPELTKLRRPDSDPDRLKQKADQFRDFSSGKQGGDDFLLLDGAAPIAGNVGRAVSAVQWALARRMRAEA
jgi:hypothetical protein